MKTRWALCLYAGVLSTAAWAGCGEGSGQCYYYQAGALKSRGACQVTTCSATDKYFYSTWEWQKGGNKVSIGLGDEGKPINQRRLMLNGKPAYALSLPLKDDKMVCYGVIGTDELMCNDSGNF